MPLTVLGLQLLLSFPPALASFLELLHAQEGMRSVYAFNGSRLEYLRRDYPTRSGRLWMAR